MPPEGPEYHSSILSLTVDGQVQTLTFAGTIPATTPSTSATLKVGAIQADFGNFYATGSIDEVRAYNRALSATEVAVLAGESDIASSRTFVYGHGLLYSVDQSGALSWRFTDALGSTSHLLDGAGNVKASYIYDPFGAVHSHTGARTEFSFTGEQNDTSGLEYLRARYYDPATGRFLSRDPLESGYVYASNNPLGRMDPTGLASWPTDANLTYSDAYEIYQTQVGLQYAATHASGQAFIDSLIGSLQEYASATNERIFIGLSYVQVNGAAQNPGVASLITNETGIKSVADIPFIVSLFVVFAGTNPIVHHLSVATPDLCITTGLGSVCQTSWVADSQDLDAGIQGKVLASVALHSEIFSGLKAWVFMGITSNGNNCQAEQPTVYFSQLYAGDIANYLGGSSSWGACGPFGF